jgi:hypothetical protein
MNKEQAITEFWNNFGIPAFDENTPPDNPERKNFPYMTFNVTTGNMGQVINLGAKIWYRSASWRDVTLKKEEIGQYIGDKPFGKGHKLIKFDDGMIQIDSNTFSASRQTDPNDEAIKAYVINMQVEFLSAY